MEDADGYETEDKDLLKSAKDAGKSLINALSSKDSLLRALKV